MSITEITETVKKHWAVAVALCIVILPSMWFAMDYLYKARLEERDARIRALEAAVPHGETHNQQKMASKEPQRLVPITGKHGTSASDGSAWIDLSPATDFPKGDRLRLRIGGNADRIVVRLLPIGASPDKPVGVIAGPLTVPRERVLEVTVPTDQRRIIQISVHGGSNPWGAYLLGSSNGPATLEAVELVR